MKRLQQIAEAVEARLHGDGTVEISGVASIGSAVRHDLVFVEEEKYLLRALESGAGAVIAGEFAAAASGKPMLISRHPKLAFARAARFLQGGNRDRSESGVHASAVVHPSARLGQRVVVEEHGVVAEDAEIGEGTRIGAGCAIGRGVKIGRDCRGLSAGNDLCGDDFGRSRDRACGRGVGERWLRICARCRRADGTRNFLRLAGW